VKQLVVLIALISFGLAACSADDDSSSEALNPDASDVAIGADGNGASNTDVDGPVSDERSELNVPSCRLACETPADCGTGSADSDADNFLCEDGACIPLGCNSETECVQSFTFGYTCAEQPGGQRPPICQPTCANAEGCTTPDAPVLFDADNVACVDGACQNHGCNNDQECSEGMGRGWVCATKRGFEVSHSTGCSLRCDTPLDCVGRSNGGTAADADKYACVEGVCLFTGCKSDSDCENSENGGRTVCR